MALQHKNLWGWVCIFIVAALIGLWGINYFMHKGIPDGIATGNGRLEATEIDISTTLGGRIADILVREGETVQPGQVLVKMDISSLEAQLKQAEAQLKQTQIGVETARFQVEQSKAEQEAAQASLAQAEVQRRNTQTKMQRSSELEQRGTISLQMRDDNQANYDNALAAEAAARAKVAAGRAAQSTAEANVINAQAQVDAAHASIERIQSEIDDSSLKAPRLGRVQYRIAQPGEVVAPGGRVLNMIDLSDVYITFFLPTAQAGKVAIGADARIVLDAAPEFVLPAHISFISDVSQFTPKSVETTEERARLMFRMRAKIPQDLLMQQTNLVKTGLPGVVYVKLWDSAIWPDYLANHVLSSNTLTDEVNALIRERSYQQSAYRIPAMR